MINLTEAYSFSLGTEPFEVLGFENEDELEAALALLMEETSI